MMKAQSPFVKVLFVLLLFGIMSGPFFLALSTAAGGKLPRFTLSNVITQGKVLYIGPSTVSSSPAVVLYGYNTPDFPWKPWSFQREQIVSPKDLARFRIGMTIPVEYSQASSGTFLVLFVLLLFSAFSWGKKMRQL